MCVHCMARWSCLQQTIANLNGSSFAESWKGTLLEIQAALTRDCVCSHGQGIGGGPSQNKKYGHAGESLRQATWLPPFTPCPAINVASRTHLLTVNFFALLNNVQVLLPESRPPYTCLNRSWCRCGVIGLRARPHPITLTRQAAHAHAPILASMKLLERLRSGSYSSDRCSSKAHGSSNTHMPLPSPSTTCSGASQQQQQQQQQHVPSPLRRLSVTPPPLPSLFAPGQKSEILSRNDLQKVRNERWR